VNYLLNRKSIICCITFLFCFLFLFPPRFQKDLAFATQAPSLSLEETISRRLSTRDYTSENISSQQLLEVLCAAYGHNNSYRSIPEIGYNYPLIIFPVNETGSYQYIPENNSLVVYDLTVNKETIHNDFPSYNSWVTSANVILVIVWNQSEASNQYFASAEAGCLVQNVYLAAASLDLGTCCVGGIDSSGLSSHLKLPSSLIPLLVMPLGYPVISYPPASPNYDFMTGNLPPVQYSTLSFEDALKNMLFAQNWSARNLSTHELSQLFWASYGYTNITHDSSYHRTTPSSRGIYPLVIFVSNATGVYQYLPENHSVKEIVQGDRRFEIANVSSGQLWATNAPAIFLVVYNSAYNGGNTGDGGVVEHLAIEVDAGAVVQELFLEASAWNLSTNIISQGLEDWNGTGANELRNILGLSSSYIPLYLVTVGSRIQDMTLPQIGIPSQNPEPTAVGPYQNVTVTVNVVDNETGIREVILSYTIDEGQTWINITMKKISNDTYREEIPGFEADTHVQYQIIAYDNANNIAINNNNNEYYVYTVITEFQLSVILIFMTTILITVIFAKKKKRFFFQQCRIKQ